MAETLTRKPSDIAFPHVSWDDCVYGEDGPMESVVEVSKTTRGKAIAAYAHEVACDFTEVRCRTVWGRFLTRQEVWDRAYDEFVVKPDHEPAEPPADWEPYIEADCWTACEPDEPGATKLYLLEARDAA